MQFVSQNDINRLSLLKRDSTGYLKGITGIEHVRSKRRNSAVEFWLLVFVIVVSAIVFWVHRHVSAIEALYEPEFAWWRDGYTKGPEPHGAAHYSMMCVCLSMEYPTASVVLSGLCGTLPQTSAMFILIMVQHFGASMEGIHYSGSRDQLNGKDFKTFISSYAKWTQEDNHWKFLIGSKDEFARSVAIQNARARKGGGSILEALYNGGLCHVAVEFYKPDISAPEMCRMLLDEHIVYTQPCGAAKLAKAMQVGGTAGSITGGVAGVVVGSSVYASSVAATASGIEAASAALGGTFVATAAAEGEVATASVACGPFAPFCFVAATLAVVAVVCATSAATDAATTATYNALAPCPFGNHYTLVMQPDGSYKKQEWDGGNK